MLAGEPLHRFARMTLDFRRLVVLALFAQFTHARFQLFHVPTKLLRRRSRRVRTIAFARWAVRVRPIAFAGEFFRVPGLHLAEPSPQRTPFLFQAGASPRGLRFAARHAEAVFVAAPSDAVLARQVAAVRAALAEAGRAPESVPVINQQTLVIAETDAQAHALYRDYLDHADPVGAAVLLSGWTGIDFAALDADAPLAAQGSNAIQSAVDAFTAADPSRVWTPREIADYARIGGDGPVVVGSPETVADVLEHTVETTGVSGFNLAATVTPEGWRQLTELLVPELRRRGRRPLAPRPGSLREKLTGAGPRLPSGHLGAGFRSRESVGGDTRGNRMTHTA